MQNNSKLRPCVFKTKEKGMDENYIDVIKKGLFHGWGLDVVETREQICNYTVGIIETNGKIELILPQFIEFID